MKNTKKEVLRNCIPAMVCMVISGLNTIIDGLFIGRNIGEDGLAAINIAWPVPAFILASGIGIGVGCGINYVSALGKKHEKEAKEFLKNAFVFLACAGILYSVFFEMTAPYLMKILGAEGKVHTLAVQYTRIIAAAALLQIFGAGLVPIVRNLNMPIQAMAATISGVCSNFVFNTIFIFVLQMGMRGAALGTVLSQVVTSVIAGVSIKKSGALSREDVEEKAENTGGLSCYKKVGNKILSDKFIEEKSEKEKYFQELMYIFKYEGQIRQLIIDYKFNEKSYIYKTFVNFLLKNKKIFENIKKYDKIIPVPISKKRYKERGYNQSLLIANEISKQTNLELVNNCLIKTKNIIEQSKLNKEDRQQNIQGVYSIQNEEIITNKKVLLIDDIYTTGSTVNECSKILQQARPERIGVLVLAKD